ncbi:sigma factor [Micromonospora mirobrigensis]|uniref:Sigma-70 region 2 n=1 Tax=Micromonospora mirobrigensis TaxID=262898 RepID=A0A1C4WZZ1_9ACTN|nr:sigma factor [Micromonospora mirobrigensis]SCF01783.1 Sigma-70 region 2 [Micromonospora mirobrigensis]
MGDLDEAASVFTGVRPRLFGIAYRMLGSASEADGLLQDVWLRWQATDRSVVDNPGAFLATTTTRLAIDELRSARARRETYVGPWLRSRSTPARTRSWVPSAGRRWNSRS